MENTPLQELVPVNEHEGWHSLLGYRRYRHTPQPSDHAWIRAFFAGTDVEILEGGPWLLDMSALRFNSFFIMHMSTPELRVRWNRQRPSEQARYMLVFVNRGLIAIEGDTVHGKSSHGNGLHVVFPGSEPVDLHSEANSEAILFTFERDEIAPYIITPSNVGDIDPNMTVILSSYAYLKAIVDVPRAAEQPDGATEILRALTREVARALTKSFMANDRFSALFLHAQQAIDERSIDPGLDVATLAAHCEVSRRTLERMYWRRGLSPAHEIRRSRARRAFTLLSEDATCTVAEAASASGFRSTKAMAMALKATYGLSATATRNSLAASTSLSSGASRSPSLRSDQRTR